MKEYLKMADVFDQILMATDTEDDVNVLIDEDKAPVGDFVTGAMAEYAAHAINSHDELVKKLKTAELTLDEVEWVLSEAQKNGNYDFDDLLEEVIYAIKRIGEDD